MSTTDRVSPHDLEAETSVLGAVLVQNDAIFAVADSLKPEHFFRHGHRVIFGAMLTMAAASTPIDYLSLKVSLGAKAVEEIGAGYISSLTDGVPRSTNITYYAKRVIDLARLRAVIDAGNAAGNAAYAAGYEPSDVDDVIHSAQDAFLRLGQTRLQDTLFSATTMTRQLVDRIATRAERQYAMTGLATGIHELDVMSHGLQAGELVVIGARPSVGKTAFALQVALYAASRHPVLFCSLEMGKESVWDRALFHVARVDGFQYTRGHLQGDDATNFRIARALEQLDPLHFWLDEQPGMTPMDVRTKAQQVQLQHGLDLLVVDYLQLMRPSDRAAVKGQNRAQIVGDMTRDLKEVARTLQVPVLLLSQLRRASEEKDRPGMADLRDSGDIEAHADIILLLHRKETRDEVQDLPVGDPTHVEILVEKQRGNPTGTITLLNFREHYRFASAARGDTFDYERTSA